MGKPTGFIEYKRRDIPHRDPSERVQDFGSIYQHQPDDVLKQQGARCMDCGVPFCMSDSGCPVDNLIPEWNDLVYKGRWKDAYERLAKTNNFPEFTGAACPAPCENACVLAINEPAVTIKSIEWAIIERAWQEGWVVPKPPSQRTGKRVAVIGSGPAGLAAADQLNKAGHHVTVFERDDRAGGLLMYGVPNMKLEKSLVQRRVDLLTAEGVEFRVNANVGVNVDADQLRRDHDAVLLACGALKGRDLQIPGRELEGVHMAMEFLHKSTKSLLDSGFQDGRYISAKDRTVVVIGGGDTGTDCVATAIRHGCESLINITRRAKPPLQRRPDNPWPLPPDVYVVDYGHEEAADAFGRDPRKFGVIPKAFVGDEHGRVKAVRVSMLNWHRNKEGRWHWHEVPDTTTDIPADLVLLAVGFDGPEDTLVDRFKLARDRWSNVQADYGKFQTSVPGVFTAGDMRRGASLIVWAINEGRGAAREIDRFLMGATTLA